MLVKIIDYCQRRELFVSVNEHHLELNSFLRSVLRIGEKWFHVHQFSSLRLKTSPCNGKLSSRANVANVQHTF